MQPCLGGCSALGHKMLTCIFSSKVSAPSALLCRDVGLSLMSWRMGGWVSSLMERCQFWIAQLSKMQLKLKSGCKPRGLLLFCNSLVVCPVASNCKCLGDLGAWSEARGCVHLNSSRAWCWSLPDLKHLEIPLSFCQSLQVESPCPLQACLTSHKMALRSAVCFMEVFLLIIF